LGGPTSNGQRHGLRGGFQRPWKGDRQLRSMVRCEEPTAMRILMGGFRGTLGAQCQVLLSFARFQNERCATLAPVARLRGLAMVSLPGLRLLSVPKNGATAKKQPEYREAYSGPVFLTASANRHRYSTTEVGFRSYFSPYVIRPLRLRRSARQLLGRSHHAEGSCHLALVGQVWTWSEQGSCQRSCRRWARARLPFGMDSGSAPSNIGQACAGRSRTQPRQSPTGSARR
jgi:hypothetical protein